MRVAIAYCAVTIDLELQQMRDNCGHEAARRLTTRVTNCLRQLIEVMGHFDVRSGCACTFLLFCVASCAASGSGSL